MKNVTNGFFQVCRLLLILLLFAQISVVLMRYLLGYGLLELQDLVTYSFSAIVVLSIPLTFRKDRHVRVDVFRAGWKPTTNRRIDQFAYLFFGIPVFGMLVWHGWPHIQQSWSIFEGSRETGGLPGLFLVKSTLLVMTVLMVAFLVHAIFTPLDKDRENDA